MPNIKKNTKIISCIDNTTYPDRIKQLLRYLVGMSKQGIIRNYEKLSFQISERLYNGDFREYMKDYETLFKDKIIRFDGRNLLILLFTDTYLFRLMYRNNTKRQYIKNSNNMRWFLKKDFIDPYSDLYKKINDVNKMGVKVPVSLLAYLISRPAVSVFNYSPDELLKENLKRSLPNKVRLYYLLLMCVCNTNGIIKDFNCHFAVKEINRLFGEGYFSFNTANHAHNKLISLGLITQVYDKDSNCNTVCINGYKDGFGPTKRYIVIPYSLISDPVFRLMSNASTKVLFELLTRLNNGEDKVGLSYGSEKYIQYKLFSCPDDSDKERKQLSYLLSLTKRRNSYEINKVMGELLHFFIIEPDKLKGDRGYYNIKLRSEYFIKKDDASSIKIFIDPSERYYKKAALIRNYMKEFNIECDDKNYYSIIRILHKSGNYVIKKILYCLSNDIQLRNINGWSKIDSIGAYTYWLYSIYKKDNSIIKDKLNALFYKMNDEMEKEILEDVYRKDNQALELYKDNLSYINNIQNDFDFAI